jgi:hypothetical protein
MQLLGRHVQPVATIRELAILCHALDESAQTLFYSGTYSNRFSATKAVYDALLSRNLIHLAIAIRTNLYQGSLQDPGASHVTHCGFLDVATKGQTVTRPFTIKDVCDKIIHANTVGRQLNRPDEARTVLELTGEQRGEPWRLDVSIELFSAAVLNWLDDVELSEPDSAR